MKVTRIAPIKELNSPKKQLPILIRARVIIVTQKWGKNLQKILNFSISEINLHRKANLILITNLLTYLLTYLLTKPNKQILVEQEMVMKCLSINCNGLRLNGPYINQAFEKIGGQSINDSWALCIEKALSSCAHPGSRPLHCLLSTVSVSLHLEIAQSLPIWDFTILTG